MTAARENPAARRSRAVALLERRRVRARRAGRMEWRDARLGDGMRLALRRDPATPKAPARLTAFIAPTPHDPTQRRKLFDMALDVNRARAPAWGYGVRLSAGTNPREGEHFALEWRLDGDESVDEDAFARDVGAFVERARALRRAWRADGAARAAAPPPQAGLRL